MLILNNMYVGGYLTEGDNIGHEVINFLRAEDGNFYIWLNSMGVIPNEIIKKCNKHGHIDVLMIRPMTSGIYKVIGIANDCKIDEYADSSIKDMEKIYDYQKGKKYKLENKCFYIQDIFSKNKNKGNSDAKTTLYTFYCEKIFEPIVDLYITSDLDFAANNKSIYYFPKRGKQTLRQYYYDFDLNTMKKNNKYVYKNYNFDYLNTNRTSVWKEVDKFEFNSNKYKTLSPNNFYRLIRKENDEVTISNSIVSFLNILDKKDEFVKKISGVDSKFDNPLREEFNIDLLFSNGGGNFKKVTKIIIIENKIDAVINGVKNYTEKNNFSSFVKENTKNYVQRYYDNLKDDERNNIIKLRSKKIEEYFINDKEKKWSQLAKYYIFALNQLLDNESLKDEPMKKLITRIHPFLLIPNYRNFEISKKNNKVYKVLDIEYAFLNMYSLITYKDIYDFFIEISTEKLDDNNRVRYDDFKEVLLLLSNELNNSLEFDMMQKLYNIIEDSAR